MGTYKGRRLIKMALLTKPCNATMTIKADKAAQFEADSKKNAISQERLKLYREFREQIDRNSGK